MSSILKALKKLEEEKASRRDEALDLPREILAARREKRSFAPYSWAAVLIASLLSTIVLTTLVVSRRAKNQNDTSGAVATGSSAQSDTQARQVRNETANIKTAVQGPEAPPTVQQRTSSPADTRQAPSLTTLKTEDRTVITTQPSLPDTAPLPLTEPTRKPATPLVSEPSDAALTVSGIAWNKDSSERLAIINGQPTSTGTTVNGFVVDEILPDRVRFSAAGKIIEILIGKTGKANK